MAMRVPTSTVSAVDFVANLRGSPSAADVNAAFEGAANGELRGILESWYDNEWGYGCRLADLVAYVGARGCAAISRERAGIAAR